MKYIKLKDGRVFIDSKSVTIRPGESFEAEQSYDISSLPKDEIEKLRVGDKKILTKLKKSIQ